MLFEGDDRLNGLVEMLTHVTAEFELEKLAMDKMNLDDLPRAFVGLET